MPTYDLILPQFGCLISKLISNPSQLYMKLIILITLLLVLLFLRQVECYQHSINLAATVIQKQDSIGYVLVADVNNYHYDIHVRIGNQERDWMDSISQVQKRDNKISTINRIKNNQSIFGTVDSHVRRKSEWSQWAFIQNTFFDFYELQVMPVSINMKKIKQKGEKYQITDKNQNGVDKESLILQKDKDTSSGNEVYTPSYPPMAVMHIGPNSTQNQMYIDLLKQSNQVPQDQIVSIWKGDDGTAVFHIGKMKDSLARLGSIKQTQSLQKQAIKRTPMEINKEGTAWHIPVMQFFFYKKGARNVVGEDNYIFKLKLTLSSKSIVLPITLYSFVIKQLLLSNIQCKVQPIFHQDSRNYLTCTRFQPYIDTMSLSLKLLDNGTLNLPLKSLVSSYQGGVYKFLIRFGQQDEIQLGQSILNTYYIGVQPKKSQFYYAFKDYPSKIFTFKNKVIMLIVLDVALFILSFYFPNKVSTNDGKEQFQGLQEKGSLSQE